MIPMQGQWSVELVGDAGELEHLAGSLSTTGATVYRDDRDGKFALASDSFALAESSENVVELARLLLMKINGAHRLTLGRRLDIRLGAVCQENDHGTQNRFVQLEGLGLCTRMGTPTAISGGHGLTQSPAASSPLESLLGMGQTDPTVGKILRLLGRDDFATWPALYRVFEVIQAAVSGDPELVKLCLGSKNQRRRFGHSAGSPSVGGDESRHGVQTSEPPSDPMTISEAEEYITAAVATFLAGKGQ